MPPSAPKPKPSSHPTPKNVAYHQMGQYRRLHDNVETFNTVHRPSYHHAARTRGCAIIFLHTTRQLCRHSIRLSCVAHRGVIFLPLRPDLQLILVPRHGLVPGRPTLFVNVTKWCCLS